MKPLLAVPLTPEDFWIWDSVVHRCGGEGIAYNLATLHADRRDAALMYRAIWPCPSCLRLGPPRHTFDPGPGWMWGLWRRCGVCGNIWSLQPFNITSCA